MGRNHRHLIDDQVANILPDEAELLVVYAVVLV
jgi:hypothetical protein